MEHVLKIQMLTIRDSTEVPRPWIKSLKKKALSGTASAEKVDRPVGENSPPWTLQCRTSPALPLHDGSQLKELKRGATLM
jgi:hypothetical protein